jgi:EpsI family protein
MMHPRRRAIAVALAMGVTVALAEVAKPRTHLADRLGKPDLTAVFPASFGEWREDTSMPIILPSPDVQAKLDAIYNQVLSRTYVSRAGERIMLSVAYGGDQSDGTRAHKPEVCYPAQGFVILSNEVGAIDTADRHIPVRRLMSKLGGRNEPITYWMAVGGEVVLSNTQHKLVQLRHALDGEIPDGLLVRVSSIDPDMVRGYRLHARFVADLISAVPAADRTRVFGRANA